MYERETLKLRVSESRTNIFSALPSMCSFGQRSNFVKDMKKVALIFGGLNNLITLSLSLSLSGARLYLYKRDNNTSYFTRGSPASIYDFSCIHAREAAFVMIDDRKRDKEHYYFKVDKGVTPEVPFDCSENDFATAESDNITIELFNDKALTSPAVHKYISNYKELRDDNGALKAVINSFHIEDYKDDDYGDVTIQVIAWLRRKVKKIKY